MKIHPAHLLILGMTCLGIPPLAAATSLHSYVFGSGGDRIAGAGQVISCTLGQTAAGTVTCPAYRAASGYWPRVVPEMVVGVEETAGLPPTFKLFPVRPNPLRGLGMIRYAVPRASPVSVRLYDVGGRMVERLVEAEVPAGWHQIGLNGARLGTGVFFCRMTAPGFRATDKLVLMK